MPTMIRTMLCLAALAAPMAAHAGPPPGNAMVEAANPDSVVSALQAAGYKAVLGKDASGDPKIDSAASGANFHIYFYGCTQHVKCRSIQLFVGYTLDKKPGVDKVNEWNANNRFAAAYIDKEGDPNIQWDVVLTNGGISQSVFGTIIDDWAGAMGDFQKFVGWS